MEQVHLQHFTIRVRLSLPPTCSSAGEGKSRWVTSVIISSDSSRLTDGLIDIGELISSLQLNLPVRVHTVARTFAASLISQPLSQDRDFKNNKETEERAISLTEVLSTGTAQLCMVIGLLIVSEQGLFHLDIEKKQNNDAQRKQ